MSAASPQVLEVPDESRTTTGRATRTSKRESRKPQGGRVPDGVRVAAGGGALHGSTSLRRSAAGPAGLGGERHGGGRAARRATGAGTQLDRNGDGESARGARDRPGVLSLRPCLPPGGQDAADSRRTPGGEAVPSGV